MRTGMGPDILRAYAQQIRTTGSTETLARLEREIAESFPFDRATPRLLAMVTIRWKQIEAAN